MRRYKCWHCNLDKHLWYTIKELIKRKDRNHTDYCCPKCERVIICSGVNGIETKRDKNE